MSRTLILAAVVSLAATAAGAQKVNIDYDKSAKFGSYKSFAFAAPKDDTLAKANPLMHSRIKNAIEDRLSGQGMLEDTANPDVFVTYYGRTKDEVSIDTMGYGYGYGGGWHWGGGPVSTTSNVRTYTRGTLIIDVWDAKAKTMIWRGTIEDTLSDNPEKNEKKLYKGLDKLMKKWKEMRADMAKGKS